MAFQDKVAVITGASSGIGRAAAHRFAERGASVVVAARRVPLLKEAVSECAARGGKAIAIQVDVSDPKSVEKLARQAIEACGRVDIWVNNAAASRFARVDDGPLEMHRRVIETDLLGYLYDARAAVPIFREQGSGVLINVSSATAYVGGSPSPVPMSPASVLCCPVRLTHHCSACRKLHRPRLAAAETDYRCAASRDVIAATMARPRRESFVDIARALPFLTALAAGWIKSYVGKLVRKRHFSNEPAPPSPGNLFEPMMEGASAMSAVGGATRRGE